MSLTQSTRLSVRALAVATGAALALSTGLGVAVSAPDGPAPSTGDGAAAAPKFDNGHYIVVLKDAPAASYGGGVPGFEATAPEDGERLDVQEVGVQQYTDHLQTTQNDVAQRVGVTVSYSYTTVLNGFSAELTAAQAHELAASNEVAGVYPNQRLHLATSHSPEFLGLPGPHGVWRKFGAPVKAGENVVVGVLDTGINPDHPSFAAPALQATPSNAKGRPSINEAGDTRMVKADGKTFHGKCETGDEFTPANCNDKLISARFFPQAFLDNTPEDQRADYLSPRDAHGHGSHVSGTAVGNWNVPAEVQGTSLGRVSGMAPGAKLATYKVCFADTDPLSGDCSSAASLAGIEQAVKDGVDIINYSISGTRDNPADPVELAFMNAAAAGVFVAAAAGNEGPGAETLSHPSPWVTTVAAGTFHAYEGTVKLGDGTKLLGASLSKDGLPEQTPAVWAGDVAKEDVTAEDAALCNENTLDDTKVKGKVVLCDRGVIARTAKSVEAARAGAVGMVLRNLDPTASLDTDAHVIPTVHINDVNGQKVADYLTGENPTIALLPGNQSDQSSPPVPQVAGFSSRGPALVAEGDLLKPDITAPGVNVVAAYAQTADATDTFDVASGTSMASPHIAGLAALMLAKKPDMDPSTVKSAMMTTATDMKNADGKDHTNPFDAGAGWVDPAAMFDAPLVYKSDLHEWLGYLASQGATDLVPPIRPADVNLPSIALGSLSHTDTVTRTITSTRKGTWKAKVSLPGMAVKVEPSTLTFDKAGQEKEVQITVTRTDGSFGKYTSGYLTWEGPGLDVRSAIVVKPTAMKSPSEVSVPADAGEFAFDVTPGIDGDQKLTVNGLVEGAKHSGVVKSGPVHPDHAEDDSNKVYEFTIPEGTTLTRVDLVAGDGSHDLDVYLFNEAGEPMPNQSIGATANNDERIDWRDPAPGTYKVVVNGFNTASTGGHFELRLFNIPTKDNGNVTLETNPLPVKQGETITVKGTLQDLNPESVYLGEVVFDDTKARTFIAVG